MNRSRDPLIRAFNTARGTKRVTSAESEATSSALDQYGVDLTERAREGRLDPVIGRDTEIRRVVQVLDPSRRGGYPLRRMLDTVSAHGGAELRITVGARTAVIARVSAPAPATDPWLPG